jgi:hypothetical protein
MKDTFTAHYNNNRQPIGLYMHPIHLAVCQHSYPYDLDLHIPFQKTYPGVTVQQSTIDMINAFLDWAQQQQNGVFFST